MNVITPATLCSAETLEYRVHGKVLRVFDQNGFQELVPVEFKQLPDSNKFALINPPYGTVFAEVFR